MRIKGFNAYGLVTLCILSVLSFAFICIEANGVPVGVTYGEILDESIIHLAKDSGIIKNLIFSLADAFIL